MQRARIKDEQIVRILQHADKSPVVEVAKRHGVSEPSIYAWREKFGDMGTDDVKRLNQLEQDDLSGFFKPTSSRNSDSVG